MGAPDLPRDTAPEAHEAQLAVYRRLSGAERVAIAFRLGTIARNTALAGIRRRHPEYDDSQARRALHRLLLGDEIMRRVYPHDELLDP
jgi:hypothetical protein